MEMYLLEMVYYGALVFARLIGFFVIAPIFANEVIPARLKLSISLLLTIILVPMLSNELVMPEQGLIFIAQIIVEFVIGFMIGFIILISFLAIQLAGEFIDRRMGFFLANVMDPQSGLQVPLVGQFKNILATLLFFAINGHHLLLKALMDSFQIVELTAFNPSSRLFGVVLRIVGNMFPIAFRMSLPILATLFVVDLAFGLVARTVPQMNVFVLGLPTKIVVGLFLLSLILSNYFTYLNQLFDQSFENIYRVLNLLG